MRNLILVLLLMSAPAAAQDVSRFDFGGDAFIAGRDVVYAGEADDVFMAGDAVSLRGESVGSAHLAGRRVEVEGAVGGDLYAAGMEIALRGDIAGDASLTGYDVQVAAPVGGDLRAAGSTVTVAAPVAGYALLAGETVSLEAAVDGDVSVAAQEVRFGDGARIGGILTLYHPRPDSVDVPESVLPADRVVRRQIEEAEFERPGISPIGWRGALAGFVGGILATGLLATLLAAVAPALMADLRRTALARPFRSLWIGFLALSLLSGAAFVLALTLIGIVVSPAALVLALFAAFVGYVVGVYVFGVGLLKAFGRPEPHDLATRSAAAFAGATATALSTLIPLLGWIFAVALGFVGAGALTVHLFRPRFFDRVV